MSTVRVITLQEFPMVIFYNKLLDHFAIHMPHKCYHLTFSEALLALPILSNSPELFCIEQSADSLKVFEQMNS